MKKTGLLLLIAIPWIAKADCLQADEPSVQQSQPDIVFVLLDDLRFDGLSCMGHPYIETPNIDKLSKLGMNLKNAFVTTSTRNVGSRSRRLGDL